MKLFLSLIFCLSFSAWGDCHLKHPLYSLAGPSTTILKSIGLLGDKNLKGISSFNPISQKDYSGPRIGGGIFLSRREEKVFNGVEVIYDHSRELDRYFKGREYSSVGIDSIGMTPHLVVEKVLSILTPRLEGCETEVENLLKKNADLKFIKFKRKMKIIFFLGAISKEKRLPELVIGNDGFVTAFKQTGQIETYPSELNYIRWSQKILKSLSSDFLYVGISEPKDQKEISFKKLDKNHFNIIFPGALTPGQTQLELMSYIVKNL